MTGILQHATAVALDENHGVLILGDSGTGKSTLALRLMAFGAFLVADDQVQLYPQGGHVLARAPAALRGQIEARGVGILGADVLDFSRIILVVDLSASEPQRLPQHHKCDLCGVSVPLVYGALNSHLDVSILQWLKSGRLA